MVHTHDAPPGSAPFKNLFVRNHLLPCCLCISSLQALLFHSCCLIMLDIIFVFFSGENDPRGAAGVAHTTASCFLASHVISTAFLELRERLSLIWS